MTIYTSIYVLGGGQPGINNEVGGTNCTNDFRDKAIILVTAKIYCESGYYAYVQSCCCDNDDSGHNDYTMMVTIWVRERLVRGSELLSYGRGDAELVREGSLVICRG